MRIDAEWISAAGAAGIAFGILNLDRTIDVTRAGYYAN